MHNEYFYSLMNDDELLRISQKIKEKEKITSGEIVVSIKGERDFSLIKKSLMQIAEEEFNRIGINKTKDGTGILIFILLKDREFYILADSAINQKVSQSVWDGIKDEMQTQFRNGYFCKGILETIDKAGDILTEFFPLKPDDINEISNLVIVRN